MPSWLFTLLQVRRRLWFTVALYSGLGVAAALVAARFGRYVPSDFPLKLGSDAVDDLLSILASSMLAVATFSLATLVTAYTSVVGAISPHAARLLVSVGAIRNTLATFIGAFVYAMVGIVALHTGYYGAEGRVILFFFTVAVLVGVIVAMLRWIGELSSLGQTGNVIDRVAEATAVALRAPLSRPRRSAAPARPEDALAVYAERLGFVQNIDIKGLERSAGARHARIFLCVQPGDFVHGGEPLLWASGPRLDAACVKELHDRVTLGAERTHEQDPRYGMRVLGEIAARALSPGVNDAGTARDVISRAAILLRDWAVEGPAEDAADPSERVVRPALSGRLLLEEAMGPVIQHGASHPGLQMELQHALAGLAALPDPELAAAAWQVSRDALARSSRSIGRQADRRRVHEAAMRVLAAARSSSGDETLTPRVR
ncbi:DUF2254 domain-containing protein [Phenylobacterium sp.]|uniref:DUF2254 domain-containing protein n=1 Tax=Phenylobacterium sp. TaxID=1871053 RepID=UPI002FDFC1D7